MTNLSSLCLGDFEDGEELLDEWACVAKRLAGPFCTVETLEQAKEAFFQTLHHCFDTSVFAWENVELVMSLI